MSDPAERSGDRGSGEQASVNGQLATPGLTPISEYGEIGMQPFPGYDVNDEAESVKSKTPSPEDQEQNVRTTSSAYGLAERRSSVVQPETPRLPNGEALKMLKLSPKQIDDLVASPESLPIRAVDPLEVIPQLNALGINTSPSERATSTEDDTKRLEKAEGFVHMTLQSSSEALPNIAAVNATPGALGVERPVKAHRSISSPLLSRKQSSSRSAKVKSDLQPLKTGDEEIPGPRTTVRPSPKLDAVPSSLPSVMPIPPFSLPIYLQLELSSDRPSALYIHRSSTSDIPYESSKVKFERLLNFLFLPHNLEQVLWFGAIACLDAWLYTFTILPLRFLKAVTILAQWWGQNAAKEALDLSSFVYGGVGRVWRRRRQSSVSGSRRPSFADGQGSRRPSMFEGQESRRPSVGSLAAETAPRINGSIMNSLQPEKKLKKASGVFRHRRTRSTPSALLPNHKADILQGLLIFASCWILMYFDASRMYHSIRGQSAIKLYVIYNVLEVFDRLLGAIGQDILECLFSKETLERNEQGRSKLKRPFWMFLLALLYNVIHATALFYQVVTLNVAVNSYSNALLTLLMSNQFVEIKGTVFKKFDKENLFQLTCADIVERFQLWLMLLIIALRNIVEVGGLSISLSPSPNLSSMTPSDSPAGNNTGVPFTSGFVIPQAFTLLPKWTGEVLGPFLIVLGSEAVVDWCKHAYITKFNNVKPRIYNRFLDVLAKDYYSHAFVDQNLTKRLGLPVIPLSCLFIRACMQTYHMFLATHMPLPIPSSATTISIESEAAATSPATTATLQHIDRVFRRALGRSAFGAGSVTSSSFSWWSIDDLIALATMLTFFLALFFILLAFKLLLGMVLLSYARSRYEGMKEREREGTTTDGAKRMGGWGAVEVGEDKRKWIYQDDQDGLRDVREKEERGRKASREGKGDKLESVGRYQMIAKRIW